MRNHKSEHNQDHEDLFHFFRSQRFLDIVIAITCLSFFPLVYLIGKTLTLWLNTL